MYLNSNFCCLFKCFRMLKHTRIFCKLLASPVTFYSRLRLGQDQLGTNQEKLQQKPLKPLDLTSSSLCAFFPPFIRCEISRPVTNSRGLGPKPGVEVVQSCDGEMCVGDRGSSKSVRQDSRCVQLWPVKTLLPHSVGGTETDAE